MKFNNTYSYAKTTKTIEKKAKDVLQTIRLASKKGYDTPYASLHAPFDTGSISLVKKVAQKYKGYTVIVIGIGGSNLGTLALYEALRGKFEHDILFLDTVDTNTLLEIQNLCKKKKVVINIISKSGTTTETIANFQALSIKAPVVVTTDRDSVLWKYALVNHLDILEIPKNVGGRYSVFTPVGLFPLAVAGIDIDLILNGARNAVTENMRANGYALHSALDLYYHWKKNISIAETFVFCPEFESIGKWYRQLMGESLGKQFNIHGKEVWQGITPTVAVGSTDLHSMAQLYLGGPRDKFIMFILPKYDNSVMVKKTSMRINMAVQEKSLSEIMDAICFGFQKALQVQKRPYSTITITVRKAYDFGYLLQMKMLEIMILGNLMYVNPFDQPNVEEYKVFTKKALQ
ncbi:MAG: hypothetical protein ACMXYK_02260 [Candidatus Woesearchaeota archaeon]